MQTEKLDTVVVDERITINRAIKQLNKIARSSVFVWREDWDMDAEYEIADVVINNGALWLALEKNQNVEPEAAAAEWLQLSGFFPYQLGYAYKNTTATTNPDPAVDTQIPDLSVDIELDVDTDVLIECDVRFSKDAGTVGETIRARLYDGSTGLTTASVGGVDAWYGLSGAYNVAATPRWENNNQQLHIREIHTLTAGSHTIKVKEQASRGTNAITWGERCLTVTAIGLPP